MKVMIKFIVVLLAALQVASAQNMDAETIPWTTPLIQGYGPVKYNPTLAIQPDKTLDYKVIVKVVKPERRDGVNNSLWHIARLMNLLYASHVKTSNIHVAAMIAGRATDVVLTDEAYKKRFHRENPDLKLINELAKHGVKLYVCSQALAEHHIDPSTEVNKDVINTLSGITDLATLQLRGYVLIP